MKIFKPQHFKLYELVDPMTYKHLGQNAWKFLDPHALMVLDLLRHHYGTMIVNDWKWGGKRSYAGFRPFKCRIGASMSQHKYGKGFDPLPKHVTAEKIRKDIKFAIKSKCLPKEYNYIGGIENKVNWFHFDTRGTLNGKIHFFNP